MSVTVNKTTAKPSPKKAPPSKPESSDFPGELHPLQALRSEIDTLFDNVAAGFPSVRFPRPSFDMDQWREPFRDPFRRIENSFGALGKLSPRSDLKETDKTITITAELPGVEEADIEVTVTDNVLTIGAEKNEETHKDEDNFHLSERHYGSIKRSFTLPDTANADKAKASFKDGVLTVDVPKKAAPKSSAKKIPIKG